MTPVRAWSTLSDSFQAAALPPRRAIRWMPLDEGLLVETRRATRAASLSECACSSPRHLVPGLAELHSRDSCNGGRVPLR